MTNKEVMVWGIHAGKTGDADSLFRDKNVIALGEYGQVGDISVLPADREAYKKLVREKTQEKPGAIPVYAGQLFRFVHELKPGDYVIYPSKPEREIYIGRVEGQYQYIPSDKLHYPYRRSVKWLKHLPRTSFSQGALFEVGSAMAFFQVKNFADEFISALEKPTESVAEPESDETVRAVVSDIEDSTRDYILKHLKKDLAGHPLEHLVAHLLQTMGYHTRVSKKGADGGLDIIAHKDELGFEPPIVKVQVKSSEETIGEPVVASLYGKVGPNEYGLFVTLGKFTPQARNFERSKQNLRLIDGKEFLDLIFEHYEQFEARYKGLIPLKRVYIPDEDIEG